MYLRCFSGECPKKWLQWLSWSEFCYNKGFQSSLRATPFEVVYGRTPPRLLTDCPGLSKIEAVDQELLLRDQVLQTLRQRRAHTQNVMKAKYDSSHWDFQFQVGDQVLLRLQPYRQGSVASRGNEKLAPRFYGPFTVGERIGPVTYKLILPTSARIHPVFYISALKPFKGDIACSADLPVLATVDCPESPQTVLDSRSKNGKKEFLIHWTGLSPADASWLDEASLQSRFPEFMFEDDHVSPAGSNVTKAGPAANIEYQRFTHGKFRATG